MLVVAVEVYVMRVTQKPRTRFGIDSKVRIARELILFITFEPVSLNPPLIKISPNLI